MAVEEKSPKLSDNMFNSLVCTNIIGVFIAAPDGRILDANDKYLEIIGYTRDDLQAGRIDWMTLTPPEYRNKDLAALKELYQQGYSSGVEKEYARRDGRRIPIIMGAGLLDNKTCNYIGFIIDLSKQKRVEQELREKGALQSRAERIGHFGAYELNIENNTLSWSDEVYRIFGLEPQAPMSFDRYLTFLRPDDRERVTRAVISALNTQEPFDIEYAVLGADGRERVIFSRTEAVLNKSGGVARLIGTMHDITGRRKAERSLIDAKNQSDMYLDLMGHDISNMNQVARGYLEMARDAIDATGKLDGDGLTYIDKPLEAIDNVSRLIDNVRKLRKLHDRECGAEKIDLCRVLDEVQKELPKAPGTQVKFGDVPAGSFVMANALIKDVFTNLIGNAIKHANRPVMVSVEVARVRQENVDYCRIAVEDDGPGIPDMRKEQVFRRFKQENKVSGSGLGLYMVKALVDDCHGRVWVEDRVRGDYTQGCRFVVLLPSA
jgi:PAS domain S-box-containing protein